MDKHAEPAPLCECRNPARGRPPESIDELKSTIEHLERELIACQRLALLGNLTAMVAHEFNNLLTPIVARAEAALQGEQDAAYMRKTLERALVQGQRAMAVTRRLLDLAHEARVAIESCCLADVVQEAIETMTRPAEKDGVRLTVSVPPDLRVRGQRDLLCQVLLNLLLNARRAASETAGGVVAITAAADGTYAQIDVRDNGPGLPRETLNEVVNPFLAADPREHVAAWQQVGLGLSVCRMIAHQHGATLRGTANEDRGCTFRLLWPLARDAATCQ